MWELVAGAAVLIAFIALPIAGLGRLRSPGRSGRGYRGRRGERVRVGPGLPMVLGWAVLRRADSLLLAAAAVTLVVAVVLNARA